MVLRFDTNSPNGEASEDDGNGPPLVAPLLKVQRQFPSMITVGRTLNNDVVVLDKSVSKFHAYFRVEEDLVEVVDAQSRNGTFVSGYRLIPNEPVRLESRGKVRFGRMAFELCDASSAWDRIERLKTPY